jgi:hypothetical protein
MALTRWASKRDGNEGDVMRAITKVGAKYIILDAFDLLVLFRGRTFMLEVKTKTGRLTDSQETLLATGWPLLVVRSPDEALKAIGAL